MSNPPTDITLTHYSDPRIKAAILKHCLDPEGFRALNAGTGWYTRGNLPGEVRLTTPDDYEMLIRRDRVLYATIDILDYPVQKISERWNAMKNEPENTIGTLRDCKAYKLSVDIDSIPHDGLNIMTSPEIKQAVQSAGQFFVDYLKMNGIERSVHCLYSGGGIYVHVHHELFRVKPDWSPEDREFAWRSLTMAYNMLIADIERRFFEVYPEYKGLVKIDKLNGQKKKFKVIFSIHKTLPVAVIPLDPRHIEIDFERAKLPLSAEVIEDGARWYQEYDTTEKEALKELLRPFTKEVEEDLRARRASGDYEVRPWYREPLPIKRWPECMKNILNSCAPDRAPHRALATLAAYLFQAGWPEDEAFKLWDSVAAPLRVEVRVFESWFGVMCCPSCDRIQSKGMGYPAISLGEYGYCPGRCY